MPLTNEELQSVVLKSSEIPLVLAYFRQPRVLQKLQARLAADSSKTIEELVQAEGNIVKLVSTADRVDLFEAGYSPEEYSGFSMVKRRALVKLRCEPAVISALTDIQVQGLLLNLPDVIYMQAWFNEHSLEAAHHGVPFQLFAPLDAHYKDERVQFMDEVLARLALYLTPTTELTAEIIAEILSAWNQRSPPLVTKDLRVYLAKLIKDSKSELDNKMKAKISWAVQHLHKPGFSKRGLISFIEKIRKLPLVITADAEQTRILAEKQASLNALATAEESLIEKKFASLIKAYDSYQNFLATTIGRDYTLIALPTDTPPSAGVGSRPDTPPPAKAGSRLLSDGASSLFSPHGGGGGPCRSDSTNTVEAASPVAIAGAGAPSPALSN